MNTLHMTWTQMNPGFRVLVLLLGIVFSTGMFAGQASAAQVTVFLPNEEGLSPVQHAAKLKDKGFSEAVYVEALGLLPGPLSEVRARYLKEFLEPRAGQFVLSYSQGQQVKMDEGTRSTVDVRVNKAGLKTLLQRLGLFSTLHAGQPFSLSMRGPVPDQIVELNKLQVLSGVMPDTISQPDLEVSATPKGDKIFWTARLVAGPDFWEASGPNLDDVWYRVWGGFFSRKVASRGDAKELPLTVSGWFFPEGAAAFDRVLASWDPLVEQKNLMDVSLNSLGVSARWSVAFSDRSQLEEKLKEYTQSRGLSFVLGNTVDKSVQ